MTLAPPSLDESVVVRPWNAFISTYGQFAGRRAADDREVGREARRLARGVDERPARVCGPSASGPVASVAVAPEMVGAPVPPASSVTPVMEASVSLAVTEIEDAVTTVDPSAGVAETKEGAELSTRREATTLGAETLPLLSCAIARKSNWPSETVAVSNPAEYGGVASLATGVHTPDPDELTWNSTLTVSGSGDVATSVTLPESRAPGSASVTVGGVESTVIGTPAVVVELPAASVTIASIVCAPLDVVEESQVRCHGAEVTVPIEAPSRRNSTVATPEPPSAGLAPSNTPAPATVAPAAGGLTTPVGAVLSMRVVTTFDVTTFAPSPATALRS